MPSCAVGCVSADFCVVNEQHDSHRQTALFTSADASSNYFQRHDKTFSSTSKTIFEYSKNIFHATEYIFHDVEFKIYLCLRNFSVRYKDFLRRVSEVFEISLLPHLTRYSPNTIIPRNNNNVNKQFLRTSKCRNYHILLPIISYTKLKSHRQ